MLEEEYELNSVKQIINATKQYNYIIASVVGLPSSGKTSFTAYLVAHLQKQYDTTVLYTDKVFDVTNLANYVNKQMLVIINDDITYALSKHTKEIDTYLRNLMLIRHSLQYKKYFIAFIYHDITSILPIARRSHIFVTFAPLVNEYDVERLKDYYKWDYLFYFYRHYAYKKYYALVRIINKHIITHAPKFISAYETYLYKYKIDNIL